MGMNTKKKNALFGRYPSCDMLNNALRFIYEGKIDSACSEIVFAIEKAHGYFHEDVVPIVEKVKSYWAKTHSEELKDREQIVRCKDCKFWHDSIRCQMYSEGMETGENWFCADGERR